MNYEPIAFTFSFLDLLLFFLYEKWKGFFMCLKLTNQFLKTETSSSTTGRTFFILNSNTMNTITNNTPCPVDLKARLKVITHDNIIWPHAEKVVVKIKEQLAGLWISAQEIEQIETT